MAENKQQSLSNHTKLDPPFHFFLLPMLLLALVLAIWNIIRNSGELSSVLLLVLTIIAVVATFKTRIYSLKVQDRVIRLEERLRLASLLSEPLKSRIPEISESQFVALRFASDAEIPSLVERTLKEQLKLADIKKSIQNWRADYFRV